MAARPTDPDALPASLFTAFAVAGPRGGRDSSGPPELLYRWPADARLPDRFVEFCFPQGAASPTVPSAPALTTQALRAELAASQAQSTVFGAQRRDPFVFTLSGEKDRDNLYGICVTRAELAYVPTSFAPLTRAEAAAGKEAALSSGSHPFVTRCYCLISHVPALPLLHDVLLAILMEDSLLCADRTAKMVEEFGGPPRTPSASVPIPSPAPATSSSSSQPSSPMHVLYLPPAQGQEAPKDQKTPMPLLQHLMPQAAVAVEPLQSFQGIPPAPTPPLQGMIVGSAAPSPLPREESGSNTSPPPALPSASSVLQEILVKSAPTPGEVEDPLRAKTEEVDRVAGTEKLITLLDYCATQMRAPAPGDTMHYRFPSSPQYRSWRCPAAPSAQELNSAIVCEWALMTMFERLSLENVLRVFSALMCERSLLILCDHVPTLTAIALATTPLTRPLAWQGLFISLLPRSMHDALDAPVPFVIGATAIEGPPPEGVILLDVSRDLMQNYGGPLPALPDGRVLFQRLRSLHTQARTLAAKGPAAPQQQRASLAHAISERFREYCEWLLAQVSSHHRAIVAKAQKQRGAPPFRMSQEGLATSFSASAQAQNRPFTKAFLTTQLFAPYFHRHLDSHPTGAAALASPRK